LAAGVWVSWEKSPTLSSLPASNLEIVTAHRSPAVLLDAVLEPLSPVEAKWIQDANET
jgi:hypothetical protein